MLDIVSAEPEHLNDIYKLICELEDEVIDKEAFSNVYTANLNNPNIYYLIAIQNMEIVGFASLHIQILLHHSHKIGELQELIIKHGTQGHGVGTSLFNHIKQKSIDSGCLQLEVCCNKNRTQSYRFYEKQGMRSTHYKFILMECKEEDMTLGEV